MRESAADRFCPLVRIRGSGAVWVKCLVWSGVSRLSQPGPVQGHTVVPWVGSKFWHTSRIVPSCTNPITHLASLLILLQCLSLTSPVSSFTRLVFPLCHSQNRSGGFVIDKQSVSLWFICWMENCDSFFIFENVHVWHLHLASQKAISSLFNSVLVNVTHSSFDLNY